MTIPMRYTGDGEFHAIGRKVCEGLEVGKVYPFDIANMESEKSRDHFFASIKEIWATLPDHIMRAYPSPDHLRKQCLIRTGYCTMQVFKCDTENDALKAVQFIKSIDKFVACSIEKKVDGLGEIYVLTALHAETQKRNSMGGKRFQESKQAVLDYLAEMLGCTADEIRRAA